MNSFNRKRIDVRLTLANKAFPNQQDANTLDLKGFQVLLDIKQVTSTSDQGNKAQIKIYGMKREDMNALSILVWEEQQVQHNKIVVFAGSEDGAQGGGMSEVFSGDITNAWADYSSSPEVCLTIDAIPMHYSRIMQAPATSYPNGVDVATAMQDLASKMGLGFVNNGVNIKLSSTYFASTLMRQVEQIAKQADILLLIQNQTMTISPKGSPLAGEIPFIHPGSGLVGYPTYHKNGIKFKCLYNPAIKLQGLIRVEDGLDIAKGEWLVKALDYQLESEKPDGAWFCQVDAARHSHGNTTK